MKVIKTWKRVLSAEHPDTGQYEQPRVYLEKIRSR
jgi:hypothetical protein